MKEYNVCFRNEKWRIIGKKSPHCTSEPDVIEGLIRVLYSAYFPSLHLIRTLLPYVVHMVSDLRNNLLLHFGRVNQTEE